MECETCWNYTVLFLFLPMLQLCVLLIPFSLSFLAVSPCAQEAHQECGQVLHCEVKGENTCEALGFGSHSVNTHTFIYIVNIYINIYPYIIYIYDLFLDIGCRHKMTNSHATAL